MRHEIVQRVLTGLAAAWLVAACASNPPTSSPASTSPTAPVASAKPSPSWVAARVAQPAAIEAAPTNAPAFCSPCHPVVGTYIDSMISFRGGFLAFGHDQPPSHAAAWTSSDATSWLRMATLPAPEGSSIAAAIVGSDGSILAVGESGKSAAVWRSSDGTAWTLTSLPAPAAGTTDWLTAVAPSGTGFVAGGYTESAIAEKTAAFWRSPDGTTWVRAAAPTPAGQSEVTGMTAIGSTTLFAVGIAGDEESGTAAVWHSTDAGSSWQALTSPVFAAGRMLSVVAAGSGAVAVGERKDQTGAAAWYSPDGQTWNWSSGPGLDNGGLEMVMMSVAADASGFVAAGWRSDAGNGSAVVWRSTDGRTWVHVPQDVSFSGAGLAAALGAPRVLVAGTMGWPDTHSAQVWIAPPG
jgi:hypothetical protein